MDKINSSNEINELVGALVKIQKDLPTMAKKEKGYGYNYASLAATIEDTREILASVDLVVIQLTSNVGGNPSVVTILSHASGQFISSMASAPLVEMKGCNEAQRAGAVYSYLRRYGLQAILNLGAEDNDASSQGFKKPEVNYPQKSEGGKKSTYTKNTKVAVEEKQSNDDIF